MGFVREKGARHGFYMHFFAKMQLALKPKSCCISAITGLGVQTLLILDMINV